MNCLHCQTEFIKSRFHPHQKFCNAKCRKEDMLTRRGEQLKEWQRDYYRRNRQKLLEYNKRYKKDY